VRRSAGTVGGSIRKDRSLTVQGEASQLKAGTAGHITPGDSYDLANPGRADTAFVLVHVPPGPRYTRGASPLTHDLRDGEQFAGRPFE